MLMIGDGVIALAAPAPRRLGLLRRFGSESYRRATEAFAERPTLTTEDSWLRLRSSWASGWPLDGIR